MKKLFVLATMLIASFVASAQGLIETVYLKNGNVIKGDIVEFQPNKSIKMETADGSLFVFEYKDIEKVTRERHDERVNYHHRPHRSHDAKFHDAEEQVPAFGLKKGYRGFVSAESMLGDILGLSMSSTHGAQLNDKIFVGGGVGMIIGSDWEEGYSLFPVYADFRVDFLNKKISPFMELKSGAVFAAQGTTGFYADFSFGCRFKRCSVSLGLNTIPGMDEYYYDNNYYPNDDYVSYYYCSETTYFRQFNFVTKFTFEF